MEVLINKKEFKGKVVLVTGASRGIGALLAKRLSENNYNVVIAAKSEKENLKPKLSVVKLMYPQKLSEAEPSKTN